MDTVTGWGVTVGSADITAALDTADADAVQEMIDERVRQLERADEEAAAQASRMMEAGTLTREKYDSVLDSARDAKELRTAIRSAITKRDEAEIPGGGHGRAAGDRRDAVQAEGGRADGVRGGRF